MAKKITVKNGPINGKTFIVPDTQTTLTHHAAPGGHYKVNTKTATWQADQPDTEPEPEAPDA